MADASTETPSLQQQNRELFILHKIAEALNRETNLNQALHTTLAQVAELFNLHTGWVYLQDDGSEQFYLGAAQNLPPALAQNHCALMDGNCTCLNSYLAGGLDNRDRVNVITCSRLEGLVNGTDGLRVHASIPLHAHGKPLGVLNVASEQAQWWETSADLLSLLHTVGDMLSIAVERARLFDQRAELGATRERNRLAREIHDTLAQGLTGIALQLESVDALLESGAGPDRIRPVVQGALDVTRVNLDEARRSVLDLRAAPLAGRTLAEALAALAAEFDTAHPPAVEISTSGGNRPLPVRLEVGLYRMAQEALANVARHAGASRVTVDLRVTPVQVRLRVRDNGRGFDPDHVPPGRFGLIGLRERAKLLGGALTLESSPGAGVRIEVTVPLSNGGAAP